VLERVEFQERAFRQFLSYPLTGGGIGSSAIVGSIRASYPHNLPLEIMTELGIVALLLWFAVLVRSYRAAQGQLVLQILLVQSFMYSLYSGDLGSNNWIVLFSLLGLAQRYSARESSPVAHREKAGGMHPRRVSRSSGWKADWLTPTMRFGKA
jgi:hypothetical protein